MAVEHELHGWGRYPRRTALVHDARTADELKAVLEAQQGLIARGLGRSYADSSLAPQVLAMRHWDHFLDFDPHSGVLRCEAGVTLSEILALTVPQGWFLAVTPGTRFVTVGGAIAADVHGKNHHAAGTFGEHVEAVELMLGNGDRVIASRSEHVELFCATCGGMGLTGVILGAVLRLQPIRSRWIRERILKVRDLQALFEAFEQHSQCTYSVAWVDCLQTGRSLGRSQLMLGDHEMDGDLAVAARAESSLPFEMPDWVLGRRLVRCMNSAKWLSQWQSSVTRRCNYESYFYPLDAVRNWNRLYGRSGFVQYQFVVPRAGGYAAVRQILSLIGETGMGSFLAVLKATGRQNSHHLSFPLEGYSLALDFKRVPGLNELLARLDAVVLAHGGRIYLAKDSCMSEQTFKASYPRWSEFEDVRARWHAHGRFASDQSRRLGLV